MSGPTAHRLEGCGDDLVSTVASRFCTDNGASPRSLTSHPVDATFKSLAGIDFGDASSSTQLLDRSLNVLLKPRDVWGRSLAYSM